MPIQQHPNYSEGFHDAARGEPLFDSCSDEYACGWLAYWNCIDLLDRINN